jgi:hypothetical protein
VPSGQKAPTYDEETLARAVNFAHTLGARGDAHSTIHAHRMAMGVHSIRHGNGLTEDD